MMRGYPLFYASHQAPHRSALYPHWWCDAVTAIPDRGTPEIRQNRISNLQLAASKIAYLEVNSGQIFSFCDRVGDPNKEQGFRAGPVFVNGEVQTGVGGGLCLIATNLFQLFLGSGWQILERHCHSIDAYGNDRFYELGQDASIAYGYKDLIVRNTSPGPLQLRLEVCPESGQVVSSLWGQSPCPWRVKIESVVLEELSSPEANISGWIVETKRLISDRPDAQSIIPKSTTQAPAWRMDYRAISIYKPCIGTVNLMSSDARSR